MAQTNKRLALEHCLLPDVRVEVRDMVAEGTVWTATDPMTGHRGELHGLVPWRIEVGKIAERWAAVTPMHEPIQPGLRW